jgi:tol-pal system protein YbgF
MQRHEREFASDFDQRLRKVEPQPVTVDGHTAPVERDEQAGFENALAQFRGSDYRGAINSLRTFLARYPQSVYAAAAQFWLGSSLYAVKDFPGAIIAHQALVEHFGDSPRVPDALLGIGASQVEMNDRKGARVTFTRIAADYPDSEAARLARERLAGLGPDEKKKKSEPKG